MRLLSWGGGIDIGVWCFISLCRGCVGGGVEWGFRFILGRFGSFVLRWLNRVVGGLGWFGWILGKVGWLGWGFLFRGLEFYENLGRRGE